MDSDSIGRIDLLLESLANGMVKEVEEKYGLEGLSEVTQPLIQEQVRSAIPQEYRKVPQLAISAAKMFLSRGKE